jgi:hypothetical protein
MGYPIDINDLQYQVGKWADATFPDSTQETIIAHMRDEINTELSPDCNEDELADIALLLMHLAHKRGVDLQQLIINKHSVNEGRTWENEKNDKGFFGHID